MSEEKKEYTLDRPDRVFHSIIGRVSGSTPSHILKGLLNKYPELDCYIVEKGAEKSKPKANVTRVEVGNETRMVEPTIVKTETVEAKESEKKETKPKKTRKKYTKSKKKDE